LLDVPVKRKAEEQVPEEDEEEENEEQNDQEIEVMVTTHIGFPVIHY
jgi:hypothetical protein